NVAWLLYCRTMTYRFVQAGSEAVYWACCYWMDRPPCRLNRVFAYEQGFHCPQSVMRTKSWIPFHGHCQRQAYLDRFQLRRLRGGNGEATSVISGMFSESFNSWRCVCASPCLFSVCEETASESNSIPRG